MTPQEIADYFQYHNSNMQLLKIGFDEIKSQIKLLYRKTDKNGDVIYLKPDNDPLKLEVQEKELALSRILSGIQVSWAEESIKRLFYEGNLFTEAQRNHLLEKKALDQKWYTSLLFVFSIAYDLISVGDELCATVNVGSQVWNLGNDLVDQYEEMRKVIRVHLIPSFDIRNKVQHGEWRFAFRPSTSSIFSQDMTDKLSIENIITTTARFHIVSTFYNMIVDMGRFKSNSFRLDSIQTPFEYFYYRYMTKINDQVKLIQNSGIDTHRIKIAESASRANRYKPSAT